MLRRCMVIFFKIQFSVSFEESSLQRCKFQISVEMVKLYTKQVCILQFPISYCVSLIMVTITRHNFVNIFQMKHFSAVKFAVGYEKNMNFLVIAKSSKVKKSSWNSRTELPLKHQAPSNAKVANEWRYKHQAVALVWDISQSGN